MKTPGDKPRHIWANHPSNHNQDEPWHGDTNDAANYYPHKKVFVLCKLSQVWQLLFIGLFIFPVFGAECGKIGR